MHEILTRIEINAAAKRIWSILADFPAYSEWNPFIRSISGRFEAGARLRVTIRPKGGREMTFRPMVISATPNGEFRWQGRLLVPGLFDGQHFFKLEPKTPQQTVFTHGELFSGLLVPLLKATLDRGTRQGFVDMNEALKARAEKTGPAAGP